MQPPVTNLLAFTRYDMSEAGSAASLFTDPASLCGIYILEFENGDEYVGQTRNIIARYAAHRRHHGDVVALQFAPCRPDQLDTLERQSVHIEEQHHNLRNLSLTNLPGGADDVVVTVAEGRSMILPWDRERRETVLDEPANSKLARFWTLSEHERWTDILAILGTFVHETIPDPVETEKLWCLTALPATSRHSRLLTLSAGSIEILFCGDNVFEDDSVDVFTRINLWHGVDVQNAVDGLSTRWANRISYQPAAGYKVPYPVGSITCEDLDAALWLLDNPPILAAAYHLNTALMRQGSKIFTRFHNPAFAAEVLHAAHTLASGSEG